MFESFGLVAVGFLTCGFMLYVLFQWTEETIRKPTGTARRIPKVKGREFGQTEKQADYMNKLIRLLSKMSEEDRRLIFGLVRKTVRN
jgi:hypothetical protein